MFGMNGGLFGFLTVICIFILGIAIILMPFWVCQIRNRSIETNKLLRELVLLTRDQKE